MNRNTVALLSCGLDRRPADRGILGQGIPLRDNRFITPFGRDPVTRSSCGHDVERRGGLPNGITAERVREEDSLPFRVAAS
jgi:hypothetical protein